MSSADINPFFPPSAASEVAKLLYRCVTCGLTLKVAVPIFNGAYSVPIFRCSRCGHAPELAIVGLPEIEGTSNIIVPQLDFSGTSRRS